jgi:archaellum component FlaC
MKKTKQGIEEERTPKVGDEVICKLPTWYEGEIISVTKSQWEIGGRVCEGESYIVERYSDNHLVKVCQGEITCLNDEDYGVHRDVDEQVDELFQLVKELSATVEHLRSRVTSLESKIVSKIRGNEESLLENPFDSLA